MQGTIIKIAVTEGQQVAAGEVRLVGLASSSHYGCRDPPLHFCRGITGEGMTKILHNVQPVSAADHAQPDHVISRVEQVRAMRG